MSDLPPNARTLSRKELARRAHAIYPGWTEESVKEDQKKLGLAPIGAPFTELQAALYDEVMQIRAALSRKTPAFSSGRSDSRLGSALPERSPLALAQANPGSRNQILCSVVLTRALWEGPDIVPDEQALRAARTWARSERAMNKRRAGEKFGAYVDLMLELTKTDATRETRTLRGRWVQEARRLSSTGDREPAMLDEALASIEALRLPEEIARRLVDPASWPHAPLRAFARRIPELTVERASKAYAVLMTFYLAGVEELCEPTRSAFAERFAVIREGLLAIRPELERELGDGTIELLLAERDPGWVMVLVAMFGVLALADGAIEEPSGQLAVPDALRLDGGAIERIREREGGVVRAARGRA